MVRDARQRRQVRTTENMRLYSFYNSTKAEVDTVYCWPGGVLLLLSYQDLQMATGILLNHLDIAAVNALVIWFCKDPTWNAKKSRLFLRKLGLH